MQWLICSKEIVVIDIPYILAILPFVLLSHLDGPVPVPDNTIL